MTKEFSSTLITDTEKFGEKLRKIRALKQLTQGEMAAKIGLTPSSYSNWELGKRKPRINRIKKVADVLGVPVSYLTDDIEIDLSQSIEDQIVDSNSEVRLPFLSGSNFIGRNTEEEIFSEARTYNFQLINKREEKDLFIFKVEGSSMETPGKRSIPPGTIAICTRRFDLREAIGKPVVLSINHENAIIREFDVDGDSLRLIPWNNQYQTISEKQTNIKIYGRVLKCIYSFED